MFAPVWKERKQIEMKVKKWTLFHFTFLLNRPVSQPICKEAYNLLAIINLNAKKYLKSRREI